MGIPVTLDEAAVERALPGIDVRRAVEDMFRALADGRATQPPQTLSLFPDHAGDFITYLGVLSDQRLFGAKLSPYIPGGEKAVVTAWTLLMSMETGAPVLLCDSKLLTTERTAATTAIAADLLAPEDARVLAIVGTGAVGLAHLRHAQALRPWTEVRLCSPAIHGKTGLPTALSGGCPVRHVSDADAAADGADVIMLCTSSGTPVIRTQALGKNVLVTSISTNAADAHEVEPASLTGFDVYCDYRATTPLSAGEMKLAAAAGTWSPESVRGDLPDLLAGRAPRPSRERPVFFRSIGLGLEDIAAAAALLAVTRG